METLEMIEHALLVKKLATEVKLSLEQKQKVEKMADKYIDALLP